MHSFAERLRKAIAQEEPLLRAMSEEEAASRHGGGAGWSRKQELGHLIDSATNNRARFVRAALERIYEGPGYDGRGWVELGGYDSMSWRDLSDLWARLNLALAVLLDRIPQDRLDVVCRIADSKPLMLEFIIEDYILHMQHHLDHILGRDQLTVYPGAAAGV